MKTTLTIIIALLFGFSIGFFDFTFNEKKDDTTIENTSKKTIDKEIIQNIEVLPEYIRESFIRYEIDFSPLTAEKWNEFIKELKKKGLENLTSNNSISLIHRAAKQNSKEAVLKLLELGFDINKKDSRGNTPLMYAINKDTKIEFINFLIENGADLHIKSKYTDLMKLALGRGLKNEDTTNEELVEFLLDNGYELDKRYFSEVEYSNSPNKNDYLFKIIDTLEINEKEGRFTYFQNMLSNVDNSIIEYMLENKVDLKTYPEKKALLHSIFLKKNISNENIIRIVEGLEVDLNIQANEYDKRTPLLTALGYGNDIEKIKFLLKNGASPNIKDKHKRTVYNYLSKNHRFSIEEKKEIEKLLNEYKEER